MRARTRRIAWGVAAVAAAGLLAWMFRPRPIPVETAAVRRGPLQVTVRGEGKTRVRERFVVSAPVGGHLERIALEPGDVVASGAVVARMVAGAPAPLDVRTRAEAEARVRSARAAVRRADAATEEARAALALARSELDRDRSLSARGALAPAALEQSEASVRLGEEELEAARAAAAAARAELAGARATLDGGRAAAAAPVEIRAPAAGRVLDVQVKSAGMVAAGTPLLALGDVGELEIVLDLLSTDAARVAPGAAATIDHWGGDAAFAGRVDRVEPAGFTKVSALGIEEQRVNVIIAVLDPPAALGDGYRVEAAIAIWERSDVLKLPAGALFRAGDRWAAFIVEGGRARLRAVEIGHTTEDEVELLAGLDEGVPVILEPSDRVADGVAVRARARD